MDCIFCKIINGEVPSLKLFEDDKIIIIMDAFPDSDGHILIIPKNHYVDYKDLPDDILLHINKYSKIYGDILMKKLNKDSLTILVNYGKSQVVKHFHMHLIPNFKSETKFSKEEIYNILMDVEYEKAN